MNPAASVQERLVPSLLDRLCDDEPDVRSEPPGRCVFGKAQLRAAVLRDLGWLLNTTQPHPAWSRSRSPLAGTVLNYGLPPLAGKRYTQLDIAELERAIRQAILDFEPRILPQTLVVEALEVSGVLETHNRVDFDIRGHLWAQPVPLEVLWRTELDLEAGLVDVRDRIASGAAASAIATPR